MTTFPHLRAAIVSQPWAILPDRLEAIAEVLERRFAGIKLGSDEIEAIKGARSANGMLTLYAAIDGGDVSQIEARGPASGGSPQQNGGVIAVISIMGMIAQHASQVDNISGPGGTSTERVANSFRSAMNDPSVVGIILNVDSPGGNVHGVQALADEIHRARGRKPIVAQVNSTMASAAYWLGAAADEIVMSPGAQAGSIGVYALHRDVSAAADKEGVKMTFVSAGKYKVEGNAYEPLADEAREAIQGQVDSYYGDFTGSVAKYRGVKATDVRNGFGEGRMLKDASAVKAGLADRIGTFDDTLRRMAAGKTQKSGARADGSLLISAIDGHAALSTEDEAALLADQEALAASRINGDVSDKVIAPEATAEPAVEQAKADETATSENDIAAQQAAERDAFRRRRHAHRQRSV